MFVGEKKQQKTKRWHLRKVSNFPTHLQVKLLVVIYGGMSVPEVWELFKVSYIHKVRE